MNNFSVKNINFVGAGAALLAFIFTFIPFYTVKATDAYYMSGFGSAGAMSASKNLVGYNFFGVLCLLLSIAAIVLYVLNLNAIMTLAATGVSILNMICLLLAFIVGNSDVKAAKAILNFNPIAKSYFKMGPAVGFFLELIVILIMIASYWINELVIKPYVFKVAAAPVLNPLQLLSGTPAQFGQAPQQNNQFNNMQ